MAGQPRGRSSVETQTRQNTHSELGALVRRLACILWGYLWDVEHIAHVEQLG